MSPFILAAEGKSLSAAESVDLVSYLSFILIEIVSASLYVAVAGEPRGNLVSGVTAADPPPPSRCAAAEDRLRRTSA